ncbi:antibiotic biosynthesis monooxygenase family protein [Stakelama saccharophila]|uniref:Antibiotic biosynthesis monooxygenase n=1 Tax=Stakelama saccharophila TaxID=3075605 RepID=A0ABZ0BA48_9SPHN|nr:antibiotic biosynthesis monooxygenase [Stakelama sp. W311]WNO53986.1 antibiotic biosynthesis monooxygenase [Stakelama sp. W311]
MDAKPAHFGAMVGERDGQIAVIFASRRTGEDDAGYVRAAARMADLAARQPGYAGLESVRDSDGDGITISYWNDAASAAAWRDHPEHVRIRELGRARWYDSYTVTVATVTRGYRWNRT